MRSVKSRLTLRDCRASQTPCPPRSCRTSTEAGVDAKHASAIRLLASPVELPADFRLGVALKLLNPNLPLIQREEIVSPGWLVEHPQAGYDLVTGPIPKRPHNPDILFQQVSGSLTPIGGDGQNFTAVLSSQP